VGKVKLRKHIKRNSTRETKRHLLRQSTKCSLCGDHITDMKDASVDHIIPKSRGGSDALDNLQIAHRSCNEQKGNRLDGWDPPLAAATDTSNLTVPIGVCDRTPYPWEID